MPAELLRASLRHASDGQRNYLFNFGCKPSVLVSRWRMQGVVRSTLDLREGF
ncbi:unnamed protein product [Brassica rapa subsp. trilocularis]